MRSPAPPLLATIRLALAVLVALSTAAAPPVAVASEAEAKPAAIQSMSALAFGPDDVLLVGDSKAGAVFALETGDLEPGPPIERFGIRDLETKIAALLGAWPSEVLIHDLAVHPGSQAVYLAVSRGRTRWESRWSVPNDLADATILLRIAPGGAIEAVDLSGVSWTQAELPDPIDPVKTHRWKDGLSLRVETVTQLAYDDGIVWVAGLSNEEFASTLWRLPFPFTSDGAAGKTTVEIFHGAHGEWETHAPIRSFVPYALDGEKHVLAAYLCTPLVVFEAEELVAGGHVRGRTVAELGSGNYPLDMLVYRKDGREKLLIAHSALPLMIVDPRDVAAFEGEIAREVEGYTAGVPYEFRASFAVQQIDRLGDDRIVALQRSPRGTLDLVTVSVNRF